MAMTSNQGLLRLAYDARGFDILKPVDETVAEIDAFRPDIIVGYPTAFYQLADAQRAGRMNIAPEFLQCSGEVVFPEHRQAIEQAFGRPLYNVYSFVRAPDHGDEPGRRRRHGALRGELRLRAERGPHASSPISTITRCRSSATG